MPGSDQVEFLFPLLKNIAITDWLKLFENKLEIGLKKVFYIMWSDWWLAKLSNKMVIGEGSIKILLDWRGPTSRPPSHNAQLWEECE